MTKTAIGTAMLKVMEENEIERVMWGDCHALDDAFSLSGSKAAIYHPLQRWQIVLNALDRDERFEKRFISIDVFQHGKRLVRVFGLMGTWPPTSPENVIVRRRFGGF